MAKQCPICCNTLGRREDEEVTTECGHGHHFDCAQQWVNRKQQLNCQVCDKQRALADALREHKTGTSRTTAGQHVDQDRVKENVSD